MLRREQKWWAVQYLGAFVALGVTNVAMAEELAALTETDQECVHCIGVMRRAKEGVRSWDIVGSGLDALRAIRGAGAMTAGRLDEAEAPTILEPAPGATTDGAAADACVGAILGGGRG